MRTCPKCQAQFDDSMSFCTEDGTPLDGDAGNVKTETETKAFERPQGSVSEISAAVTEVMTDTVVEETAHEEPPAGQPRSIDTATAKIRPEPRGTGFGVLLGALLVIGLLLLGTAIGGIFWYLRGQRPVDVATANSNQANEMKVNAAATPSFGGSGANLPDQNRANSNLAIDTKPTPDPSPTRTPDPNVSKTPEAEVSPTPNPTQTPKPLRGKVISGGVLNGKAVSLPAPAYPPAARAIEAKGAVNVQVLINENGNVVRASAVSGHPLLRNSAERAARDARFSPTVLDGQPVKVTGVIVYVFRPN